MTSRQPPRPMIDNAKDRPSSKKAKYKPTSDDISKLRDFGDFVRVFEQILRKARSGDVEPRLRSLLQEARGAQSRAALPAQCEEVPFWPSLQRRLREGFRDGQPISALEMLRNTSVNDVLVLLKALHLLGHTFSLDKLIFDPPPYDPALRDQMDLLEELHAARQSFDDQIDLTKAFESVLHLAPTLLAPEFARQAMYVLQSKRVAADDHSYLTGDQLVSLASRADQIRVATARLDYGIRWDHEGEPRPRKSFRRVADLLNRGNHTFIVPADDNRPIGPYRFSPTPFATNPTSWKERAEKFCQYYLDSGVDEACLQPDKHFFHANPIGGAGFVFYELSFSEQELKEWLSIVDDGADGNAVPGRRHPGDWVPFTPQLLSRLINNELLLLSDHPTDGHKKRAFAGTVIAGSDHRMLVRAAMNARSILIAMDQWNRLCDTADPSPKAAKVDLSTGFWHPDNAKKWLREFQPNRAGGQRYGHPITVAVSRGGGPSH